MQEPESKSGTLAPVSILSVGLMTASTILAYHKDPTFGLYFGLVGFGVLAALMVSSRYSAKR